MKTNLSLELVMYGFEKDTENKDMTVLFYFTVTLLFQRRGRGREGANGCR